MSSASRQTIADHTLGLLVAGFLLAAPSLEAQQVEPPDSDAGLRAIVDRPLRVFLDCHADCDRDYLVTELEYVHFVRDRTLSDVHVLLTSLGAGGGGEQFTLTFTGQEVFAARHDTIVFVTPPGVPDDGEREMLRRAIARGLFPFVSRTSAAAQLDVVLARETDAASQAMGVDPWNGWVFEFEVDGSADIQERRRSWGSEGEFNARRITPHWKVEMEVEGEYEGDEFELSGGREASSTLVSYGANALVVRSLSSRLSAGFTASVAHSDFFNQQLSTRVGPAVEYNFLDWSQATRQQVTLRYSIGASHFNYLEQTIYLRDSETRVSQYVGIAGRLRQPWGSVNSSMVFGNIVDEPSLNVLTLDAFAEVRVTSGFNVFAEVETSRVRNQLYIPRGDLTDEEILLGQRALATGYEFEMRIGFSYTFGSIFNTIVNPRFGSGIDIL